MDNEHGCGMALTPSELVVAISNERLLELGLDEKTRFMSPHVQDVGMLQQVLMIKIKKERGVAPSFNPMTMRPDWSRLRFWNEEGEERYKVVNYMRESERIGEFGMSYMTPDYIWVEGDHLVVVIPSNKPEVRASSGGAGRFTGGPETGDEEPGTLEVEVDHNDDVHKKIELAFGVSLQKLTGDKSYTSILIDNDTGHTVAHETDCEVEYLTIRKYMAKSRKWQKPE